MIKFDFYKGNLAEIINTVEIFCEKNLKGRRKIAELDNWCKEHIGEFVSSFADVVKATPDKIVKIKNFLDSNNQDGGLEIMMNKLPYNQRGCYIVTSLYEDMDKEAEQLLLSCLNIKVCPYCNRNYIFSGDDVKSCELDHFFPKSKYPIFASSFFNMIPVCPYCNRKKGNQDFYFYPYNPPTETDNLLKFTYKPLGGEYLKKLDELDIELIILDPNYKNQADTLRLRQLYMYHKNLAQEILIKRTVFTDSYINNLVEEFPLIFKEKEDVKKLIYGDSLKNNEYGNEPLSKFKHDIINEIYGDEGNSFASM